MERPAYNNFPKNRNGPGYGGQNQEFRDASRRIFCKLRGQRYLNPSNEWLAKFIQEKLFTFDYEETAAWKRASGGWLSPLLYSENSKANRIEPMKGPAEFGQICSVGRRKIAKKIAKNKRCYANTLRPRSRMPLKAMKGG